MRVTGTTTRTENKTMKSRRQKERSYASAENRAEKHTTGFQPTHIKVPSGVEMFKPKAGIMLIDILAYEAGKGNKFADEGALYYERTYYTHRGIGADSSMFACPRMNAKLPCPICEHRARLMQKADDSNEDLIKDLGPKERQLFWVKNLKEPDKKFQLWDISFHLFGKLLDATIRNADEEDEWGKFFFLDDGLSLKIGFEDKSFAGNSFVDAATIYFKKRQEQYDDDVLGELACLDDLIIIPDYKELKKVFMETAEEDDEPKSKSKGRKEEPEDEDEEEQPKARKTKPAPVEEEEQPKRKLNTKTPKDEDDWDDFDEEEEEAPKAKKKSKDGRDLKFSDEDEEEDDLDYTPSKVKKSPRPKAKDEEEEEEPEPEDEPEDYGEERRPKKRSKAAARDEDEEEEDGDSTPTYPKSKKKSKVPPIDEDDEEEAYNKEKAKASSRAKSRFPKDEDDAEEDD